MILNHQLFFYILTDGIKIVSHSYFVKIGSNLTLGSLKITHSDSEKQVHIAFLSVSQFFVEKK